MSNKSLYVDRIQERTMSLGPGCRAVIWFHGCSRRCPGCIAEGMNLSNDFESYIPFFLAEQICTFDGIEGITLSGGEPFEQPIDAMTEFLRYIKSHSDLSIMLYTGYLLKELKQMPDKTEIIEMLDILVDGPYRQDLNHDELWRGSSNQTIHFLSNRYASLASSVSQRKGRPMEFDVSHSGFFRFTGIPPHDFRKKLEAEMNKKQLSINW